MIQKRHVLVVLVVLSVAFAGCAGWGADGPADSGNDENQSNETNDLEDADNETNASSTNNSSGADDGAGAPADDSDDSGDSGANNSRSSDGGTGDSETDSNDGTSTGDGTDDSFSDDGSDGSDDGSGSGSDGQDGDQSPGDDNGDEVPPDDGDDSDNDDEAPYGMLTVTVEDDAGESVEGIEVVGIGPGGDSYSAETDENGQATFDLEDGDYTFSVTTDGTDYDASSEEDVTMEGEDQSITLTVTSEQEPTPETHTLTVTVQNEAEERIEGTDVSLAEYDSGAPVEDGDATTDANGQATFKVPNGDYEILVSHDDYAQPSDDRLVAVDGDTERTITVQSTDDDPETYTLTVTGVADGVEVTAEANAELNDGQEYTATASGGQAELEVPEGGYIVTAEDYHGANIHVDSDTEITLQNWDGATLAITVVDAETGEPVPSAEIAGECNLYYSSGDSYITGEAGEDGVIQAEAEVTPTACDANVYADGYVETVEQIKVPDDDGLTVELEPETNGTEMNALVALA